MTQHTLDKLKGIANSIGSTMLNFSLPDTCKGIICGQVDQLNEILADAERVDAPAVLFVCGGVYGKPPDEKFAFVSPFGNGNLPYAAERPEALQLFRLCAHHSALYQINKDFTKVHLEAWGINASWAATAAIPKQVDLTPEQQTILREAAKKPWMKS